MEKADKINLIGKKSSDGCQRLLWDYYDKLVLTQTEFLFKVKR